MTDTNKGKEALKDLDEMIEKIDVIYDRMEKDPEFGGKEIEAKFDKIIEILLKEKNENTIN